MRPTPLLLSAVTLPCLATTVAAVPSAAQASTARYTDTQALASALDYNRFIESHLLANGAATAAARGRVPRLAGFARSSISNEVDDAVARRTAMAAVGTFVESVDLVGDVTATRTTTEPGIVSITIQIRTSRTLNGGVRWEDETYQFVDYDTATGHLVRIQTESLPSATAGDDLIDDGTEIGNGLPSGVGRASVEEGRRSVRNHSGLNDKGAAVSYALSWALKRNHDYIDYENDCTNFASQVMRAGGWNMIDGGGTTAKKSTSNWFHHSKSNVSRTWGGAENFFQFGRNRVHRLNRLASVWSLTPGDVLQADWDRNGNISHTMIATKRNNRGEVFMTYHTHATKNRPLSDIVATNTGTDWYASWT